MTPVNPYSAEVAEMARAIRAGGDVSTSAEEGLCDTAMAQAWLTSIRTGAPVEMTALAPWHALLGRG